MSVFRIRWNKQGPHYHCRLFSSPAVGYTYALCGRFILHEAEWSDAQKSMKGVEFMEDSVVSRDETE